MGMVRVAGLLALLGLLMPMAVAQPTDDWVPVLDDAAADERFKPHHNDAFQLPADGQDPLIDIRAVWFQETPERFAFRVQLQDLGSFDEDEQQMSRTDIRLQVHDTEYEVRFLLLWEPGTGFRSSAQLHRVYQDSVHGFVWDWISHAEVEMDSSANTLTASFHRNLFQDNAGSPPYPGRNVTGFWARSASAFAEDGQIEWFGGNRITYPHYVDQATGEGPTLDIRYGVEQRGPLRLRSEAPVRASNGEEATFVFFFKAENAGTQQQKVTFQASGVPPGWEVLFPRTDAIVPEGGNVTVPVIVNVPFEHTHGALKTFMVETINKDDPTSIGRVELGLLYTDTPQPTGHHNEIWLHSEAYRYDAPWSTWAQTYARNDGVLYMNPAKDHALDDHVGIRGDHIANPQTLQNGDISFSKWRVCLAPRLLMGLDFDVAQAGELSVPIEAPLPMEDTVLRGKLYHKEPTGPTDFVCQKTSVDTGNPANGATLLANLGPSAPVTLTPDQTETYTLPIVPTPESDYIPYGDRAFLIMELELAHKRPVALDFSADSPLIVPGGWMRLPLQEYQDPVGELIGGAELVRMVSTGATQRLANPGAELLFEFTLNNTQGFDDTFDVNLWGSNRDWGLLARGAIVDAPNGTNASVPVVVKVPATAVAGTRADIIVEAVSHSDPDVRALARLLVVVDTEAVHPDDSDTTKEVVEEGKKEIQQRQKQQKQDKGRFIPIPSLMAVVALVAVAGLRRR